MGSNIGGNLCLFVRLAKTGLITHIFFVRVHTYYERYVLKEKFAIAYFDPRPVLSSLQVSRSFTENLLVIFM